MTIRSRLPFVLGPLALLVHPACSGPSEPSSGLEKVELTAADAPEALTDKAKDKLFRLTLTKSSKSYALVDISVDVGFPGGTRTAVEWTHEDTNGDGKLDPGESLLCTEPLVNLWDPTNAVGKTATVSFAEKRNGTFFQLGSTTWNPQ